jgi:hypothetical protein
VLRVGESAIMVDAETASLHASRSVGRAKAAARRRGQLIAVGLIAVAAIGTVITGELRARAGGAAVLMQTSNLKLKPHQSGSDDYGISEGLVGSLEKAMDASIDNKVSAFLSAPAIGSIPVPEAVSPGAGYPRKGAFVPKSYAAEYSTHLYLKKLMAQKRQLERKKAKLMSDLRARHRAVALQAAQESIALNEQHLARATQIAKMRLARKAQQAARAMAAKMREATIAKQTYIHAEAVADSRINDLNTMLRNTESYGQVAAKPAGPSSQQLSSAAKAGVVESADPAGSKGTAALHVEYAGSIIEPVPTAKATAGLPAGTSPHKVGTLTRIKSRKMSTQSDDAKQGTKLYHYLQEEKELQRKIRIAEHATRPNPVAAADSPPTAKVEFKFISTIAKALKKNKRAIKKDQAVAEQLKRKQEALYTSMKALKQSDELLFQKVNANSKL